MDIRGIRVDKNYNITLEDSGAVYSDVLDEMIDKLIEAKEKNEISDDDFKLLAGLAVRKALKKDTRGTLQSLTRPTSKTKSLFFTYTELKRNYVA